MFFPTSRFSLFPTPRKHARHISDHPPSPPPTHYSTPEKPSDLVLRQTHCKFAGRKTLFCQPNLFQFVFRISIFEPK
ncbi:hypothetical protein L5515_016218 [Caenorhabditis briggsae]|uniref:Uncharacterized protein n=1 Tax=Caenorhabditis briggsae TaxID=6238 RepID=A0AAE9JPU8_CAEBR|nr:hypothetical protein L5515_016218 [Caenorhabditis briggsae]